MQVTTRFSAIITVLGYTGTILAGSHSVAESLQFFDAQSY
jgi:hypothetical protein